MLKLSRIVLLIGVLFTFAIPQNFGQEAPKTSDTKLRNNKARSENDALKTTLSKLGYLEIPLEKMFTGHLVATVEINGTKDLRMICDTGAGQTLITPKLVEQLGLETIKTNMEAVGLGGSGLTVSKTKLDRFAIGSHKRTKMPIIVIDISHLNRIFKSVYEKPVDGIIGSDWMTKHNALVDVAGLRIFIVGSQLSS